MTAPQASSYIEATMDSGRAFVSRTYKGQLVMLNLLRFRPIADYRKLPHLAPATPKTGAEAYDLYTELTLPMLRKYGGDILFLGEGGRFLIGPPEETWDRVMLVRQTSVAALMEMAEDKAYLEVLGHRTAALADSRLLPMSQLPLPP